MHPGVGDWVPGVRRLSLTQKYQVALGKRKEFRIFGVKHDTFSPDGCFDSGSIVLLLN